MSQHKKRAELREEHADPQNFTCGKCHKVHPYIDDKLECIDDDDDEEEEE